MNRLMEVNIVASNYGLSNRYLKLSFSLIV